MPSSYTIGNHFESFIKSQVEAGRYTSASEVLREGLRLLEEREMTRQAKLEALRGEIQKGGDSGAGVPAETVHARFRARIKEVSAKGTTP